ncbi:MAG TPA: hypothetical protein VJ813_04605 [Vicinamibacterales bacterium]|nr:hypothetical protein [Vicinamibacterales bacterium]
MLLSRLLPTALFALGLTAVTMPAVAQTLSGDEKELAAYRLTMPTVKKTMAALQSLAEEAAKDPKVQELTKLKAQIEALAAKDELTEAEQAQLEKLNERKEALENERDRESSSKNPETLADMEAQIKKYPGALSALAREGLTPREVARCMMALLQASLIEGFSQGKADLNNLPAGVNPDNVRFVRENKAELEAMQRTIAGAMKK